MSKYFLLILMIFLHIVDDYYLQGILASLKQKKWWRENYPEDMYRYDYIVALITHGFSWSFMIMLPIAFWYKFDISCYFIIFMFINTAIHSIVDHIKANERMINLSTDQSIHITQIIITWLALL